MSTDIQLRGDSLRRQSEASKKYAAENDLELVDDFKLEDIGISAFHGKNVAQGSLGKFLALIDEGLIPKGSYLLVESLDRISRQNPQAATALFLQILQAGVNIVTLTDNHVYRSGSESFADLLFSVVIMSRAYEESRTKSIRVGAAWANKRKTIGEMKLTRMSPSWLKLSNDRKLFEPIPDRVEVVRSIFREAAAGKGSFQIARTVNQSNVPPFGEGSGWHESFISKILTNRAVLGEFQPHRLVAGKRQSVGEPITDYYPRIISDELFALVEAGRAARKNRGSGRKGRNNINLFSGVATCGYCAGKMRIIDKGPKPKGGIYFGCENARRGNRCRASLWPLEHLETAFLRFVSELDLSSLIGERSYRHEERRQLEARIAVIDVDLSKKRKMRDQAFEILAGEGVEISYVQGKLAELTNEIAVLEKQRTEYADDLSKEAIDPIQNTVETASLIHSLALGPKDNADDRTKVSDWVRRNVETMRIFPDGLDGPMQGVEEMCGELSDEVATLLKGSLHYVAAAGALLDGHHRRFEIAFGPMKMRAVEIDRTDPQRYHVTTYVDDKEATLEASDGTVRKFDIA